MPSNILKEKLKSLPGKSGIYIMKDGRQNIIYIGKAKNLKNRIKSYFNKNEQELKTRILIQNIKDIDIIITSNEKEALILENNLIKQYKPHFNIQLKDNKTYPYIKVTTDEIFPRVLRTREHSGNGKYFGPYPNVRTVDIYLELINTLFPLKKCQRKKFSKNHKPCLNYHITKCQGPCQKKNPEEYAKIVNQVIQILKGNHIELINSLQQEMINKSQEQNFEEALKIRDQIEAIKKLKESQQVELNDNKSFDVIHYTISDKIIVLVNLLFRKGKLINKLSTNIDNIYTDLDESRSQDDNDPEKSIHKIIRDYLLQYYDIDTYVPSSIVLPVFLPELPLLREILSEKTGKKVNLVYPVRGDKLKLLKLAKQNAELSFHELIQKNRQKEALRYLKDLLYLPRIPKIIESFDVANTGASSIITGMVAYRGNEKDKANYRIFNHPQLKHPDDYAAIKDAVYRRYRRQLKEKKDLPDLIIIDGGKGQLNSALKSLDELNIKKQPIISIAKEEELIFVPKRDQPLKFPLDDPGMKFLLSVRDETHRFVNFHHIKKRDKSEIDSIFNQITGFGAAKIKTLYDNFRTLQNIKNASEKDVAALPYFKKSDYNKIQQIIKKKKIK